MQRLQKMFLIIIYNLIINKSSLLRPVKGTFLPLIIIILLTKFLKISMGTTAPLGEAPSRYVTYTFGFIKVHLDTPVV